MTYDEIKEYGGKIISKFDSTYIKEFSGTIRYKIDGFLSRRQMLALIAILYAS